jgi:predicted GIY-YIG superfamily endonuclease
MHYVYLIKSQNFPEQAYVGYTTDISERIKKHNEGGSLHTKKYKPWTLITYLAFDSKKKALDFEKYIKVGSGAAFAKKHLW